MNRFLARALLSTWLVALASGCGPARIGKFDQHGYLNTRYSFRVVKVNNGILGGDWLLDNYYQSGKSLEPKEVDEYTITYELDINGDGATDRKEKMLLNDLRFKHRTRDAYIWLRAFPISVDLRDKELRVLAQSYVDAVAGAGYEAVKLGSSMLVEERRYAAQLLERGPAKLAARDAYVVTFDVANIDQVTITPNARKRRVQVVLIRPPFEHRDNLSTAVFPMLMLAGYANLPEDFERDKAAFSSFLGRIQIGTQLGFVDVQLEKVAAPTGVPGEAPGVAPVSPPPPATSITSAAAAK